MTDDKSMMTIEHKRKIGEANAINMLRLWRNSEYRARMIAKKIGRMPGNLKQLHTFEVRMKIANSQRCRFKENPESHAMSQNGLSHTPAYRVFYQNMRRVRKLKALGSHTIQEWEALKEKFQYRCANCGLEKPLTRDHIRPLIKGGADYISNIQPLCRSCNSKKSSTWDD